jgi:hypothetical protein
MVQYRYAYDAVTQVAVDAQDLIGKELSSEYRCLGCNNLLIAKVNGKIMRPHFSHKTKIECNNETYLHKLGKQVFVEAYTSCLSNDSSFIIELSCERKCRKFSPEFSLKCTLEPIVRKFDLTRYYTKIKEEARDGEFIPDVLISSASNKNEKIYIEIAVTHLMSEKKCNSGNKIIQIPLLSEDDVEKIKKCVLTEDDALFVGFSKVSTEITDDECVCYKTPCYGFYVYKGGKSRLEVASLISIKSYIAKNKDHLIYSNITTIPDRSKGYDVFFRDDSRGGVFIEQVHLANQRNIAVRNCYLCKYHGQNWDAENNFPIFCKPKRMKCNSNTAADCEMFRKNT